MSYTCLNCGSHDFKTLGSDYVCSFCGNITNDNEQLSNNNYLEEELVSFRKKLYKDVYSLTGNATQSLEEVIDLLSKIVESASEGEAMRIMGMIASDIYSTVEERLINCTRLTYKHKNFVVTEREYKKLCDEYYPLKKNKYQLRTIKYKENKYFVLPPCARFYLYGLTIDDSLEAEKLWTVNHWFRHKSPDNIEKLNNKCRTLQEKHIYIIKIFEFFKAKKLYQTK